MRNKSLITILVMAFIFMIANAGIPGTPDNRRGRVRNDSVSTDSLPTDSLQRDSLRLLADTAGMDSLQKAIYLHNKHIDDSIRVDSINRAKTKGIDSPVRFSAQDSLVYNAFNKTAYLYGSSKVDYENMSLLSDQVYLNMDNNLVRAMGTSDSLGVVAGKPLFKMGSDEYESDTLLFNFKTKKGFIDNVYTEQEDGFLTGEHSKRNDNGEIYIEHARYTTCDDPHPDFYISLSRAKVRPGKDVVFGPAYLVVADVPLPLAIPYGFFPFTKKYSSGFIMPSYGEESDRGFYLRDGGYYFAISDKLDLKLLAEIYTKGSWGISAASNYRKRYKYSGSFLFSYQDTKTGDKGMPDFSRSESFKLTWSHNQDAKANPFSIFSANVNFATSSYERNNLNSMYNPQALTQTTRTSSVRYSTGFSSIGMSLSTTMNINQNMRDSTLTLLLPDINVNISQFYPFKRKKVAGNERWYEKISISYTGQFSNSITDKEDHVMKADLIKDWKNGFQHQVPIKGSFTLFNYLNVTPSLTFTDRMYSHKVSRSWDNEALTEVVDTTYGFYNVYNWSMSMGLSTKVYGFWTPSRKIFGDKIQTLRHVITPYLSFNYAPDFGSSRYGYWKTYQRTDADGNVSLVEYSPYANQLFSPPGRGRMGSVALNIDNNIEMKVKSDRDSTGFKKLSIIDNLGMSMSYNMAAKEKPWSDLSMNIRLKWWKHYTFNMRAVFATYAYELDENGKPYIGNHTEWGYGRFGRFQGTSQNFSFTLNPEKLKQWFGGGKKDEEEEEFDDDNMDTRIESNMDDDLERGKHLAKKRGSGGKAETDEDGYMKFSMPWSLTFGYGITMRENTSGKFNTKRMRYPYKFSQTLNVSGNLRISDGWNINFATGYDFENKDVSMTTASLSRDLHCFNMSCSIVLAPYTSYNFTFRCNASTLTDALKYDKHSGISNTIQWY